MDIIVQEQTKIADYNAWLENRRLRLMEFIQKTDNLPICGRARENLLESVANMEMKFLGNSQRKAESVETKFRKKCRYDNKGYCRYQKTCKFFHPDGICDKFLKDGKCESGRSCRDRHPRQCKYWKEKSGGCEREELCRYLHKEGDKAKTMVSGEDMEENMDTNTNIDTQEDLVKDCNTDNTECKWLDLEKCLTEKEDTINKLKYTQTTLKDEIGDLNAQIDRLKRVAGNMHRALKDLEAGKS